MNLRLKKATFQSLVTFGILVLIMFVLAVLSREFLTYVNITNVLRQVAIVIITGSVVTLLMISGNIDLSVGGTVALTGVLAAKFAASGMGLEMAMILAVLVGGLVGALNGLMVTRLRITPVIATLGTMYVARGLTLIFCEGRSINVGLPLNYSVIGRGFLGPIPMTSVFVVIIAALFLFVERKTLLGKYSFAIGGNSTAAVLSGVNAGAVVFLLYTLVGLMAGFSGILLSSRLGAGDPNVGQGFEFDVIVAIVLGGTSLAGGEGSVIGMVIGALVVGFLGNGLNLLGVYSFYQSVFKGIVLVGAVMLDTFLKSKIRSAR
jgi:ribose/xylose/arabinose/galactoside ABC-type transport system permease subunit